jgi:thiamine-phosphate pyrophosphorylase
VILDPSAAQGRDLAAILAAAAEAGARLFQYRDKHASMRTAYDRALRLRRAASQAGATLLINDRCDLALAVDADGVHVGQGDLPLASARRLLGAEKIIGLSTHCPTEVQAAEGADYVAFGPIFQTSTKSDHEPAVGVDGLRQVRSLTRVPLFAIGGIAADTAPAVIGAGADGIAVIGAVTGAPDVPSAVRALLASIAATRPQS